jgi:ribosome-associated translation inhibitor RaiA
MTALREESEAAQTKLGETQFQLEAVKAELGKAKQAVEQANANVNELKGYATSVAKDAEAERSKLQAALDQANAEIERLKIELQQENAVPSPNGDSTGNSPEMDSGVAR